MELSGENKLSIVHKFYQKYYPSNAKYDVAATRIGAERRKRLDIPSPAEFSEDWMEPPQTIYPTYGRYLHTKFEVLSLLRGLARSVEPRASLDPCRGPYAGTRALLRLHEFRYRHPVRNLEILVSSPCARAGELKQAVLAFARQARPCDYLRVDRRAAPDGSLRRLELTATRNPATTRAMDIGAGASGVAQVAIVEHFLCCSPKREGVLAA